MIDMSLNLIKVVHKDYTIFFIIQGSTRRGRKVKGLLLL